MQAHRIRASVGLLVLATLALPLSGYADALFGNDLAGDRKLPRTWGIGVDYFTMSQPYKLDSLEFSPPVLPIADPSALPIDNDIKYTDLHFDVWVAPFLNIFGIYGQIEGETSIPVAERVKGARRARIRAVPQAKSR